MAETKKNAVRGRIILVEKDIGIRNMMEMLMGDHYQVDAAGSAEAGLLLVESVGPVDIVIASNTLPEMGGVEFLRMVAEKHPETVRILLTGGSADMRVLKQAVSKGYVSRVVLKPFSVMTLLEELTMDMSVKFKPPA